MPTLHRIKQSDSKRGENLDYETTARLCSYPKKLVNLQWHIYVGKEYSLAKMTKINSLRFSVVITGNGVDPSSAEWGAHAASCFNQQESDLNKLPAWMEELKESKVEEDRCALGQIRRWLEFADHMLPFARERNE